MRGQGGHWRGRGAPLRGWGAGESFIFLVLFSCIMIGRVSRVVNDKSPRSFDGWSALDIDVVM